MESNILDSVDIASEMDGHQRLSYDMLFEDNPETNGTPQSDQQNEKTDQEDSFIHKDELEEREKKWQQKLEQVRKEAYQNGLEEGKKSGREEALSSIEQSVAPVRKALNEIDEEIDALFDELRPYMATMTFNIAEKILEIPIEQQQLRKNVSKEIREILATTAHEINIRLHVSEKDYGYVVRKIKDLPHSDYLQIASSDELQSGEYVIDTDRKRIVKDFKKMLQDFREKVFLETDEMLTAHKVA